MPSIIIRKNEQIMMSLVHYFVTKENYSPINVQGVKDEIWLENLDGPYRVIRINCNSIINEEQYKFDLFKVQHIIKQIKKKTLSWKMNALNICLDLDKKIEPGLFNHIETINIKSLNDIKKNKELKEIFPNLENELLDTKDGLDLIINVTHDINEKTYKDNKLFEKVFSPKKIIMTKLIMLICIVMYIILGIDSNNFFNIGINALVNFGGNNLLLVQSGEVWRVISAAFLHVSLIHLLVNMYSLVIIGTQVETFIGKFKFLFVYLISALVGSLLSLIFNEANIVSVGASGAIFGLMGALLYFGYHYRLYLSEAIKNQIIPVIVLNLLLGFMVSGVDNAAHIGGLIGGYLASMAMGIENKSKLRDKANGWIVLILLIVFLSYIVFFVK